MVAPPIASAGVINCKGRAVKVLAFCHVVYEVQNHSSHFNER
jgi:hypothetical protein